MWVKHAPGPLAKQAKDRALLYREPVVELHKKDNGNLRHALREMCDVYAEIGI